MSQVKTKFLQLFLVFSALFIATPAQAELSAVAEAKTEAKADTKGEAKATSTGGEDAAATTGEAETTGAETTGAAETKEIKSEEEAVEAAGDLYKALTDRNWSLALALALALLVWLLRKVKLLEKVPANAVPWVSAGLAAAGYVVAALMAGGVSIFAAILEGAMAGAAAVGLWEMLLKHLLGKK